MQAVHATHPRSRGSVKSAQETASVEASDHPSGTKVLLHAKQSSLTIGPWKRSGGLLRR